MSKKDEFCRLVALQSKRTADEYSIRLRDFQSFVSQKYNIADLDSFFDSLKNGQVDVYDALAQYHINLNERNLSTSSKIGKIITAKNFLEYNDVPISNHKFRLKVRTPRQMSAKMNV